jgi:integrase
MGLKLYRRHRKECEGGHPEDFKSGQFEEGRRGWKRCACIIHATGTLDGRFNRKQTGKSDWDEAKAVAAQWEATGSWSGAVPEPPQPVRADEHPPGTPNRITIERAVKVFLAELQETAAFTTHKKYRLLLAKLMAFSADRGYIMIDQWEPADVREFRSSWGVQARSAVRKMSLLKPFFEYCVSNEWITRNPARLVNNPRTRDDEDAQKLPFTDEEITRMLEACPRYGGPQYKWNGEDLSDFISLSIYTGLRISDVALFHIDRMLPTGEIRIRTTKAGTHVHTWIPPWLQDRIRARAQIHGPMIFGSHTTKDLDVITDLWRRKLKKLWAMCGPWQVKPTPHRLRHTFARILLQRGVSVEDVAKLLGNTPTIVVKYYSAWVKEHQDRLTRILKEAFDDKPRPKLVVIKRGA